MKNLKIKFKIFIMAGVMMSFIVALGVMGIVYLNKDKEAISDMYNNKLLAVQYLNDNRNQSRGIEASLYHMIIHIDNKEVVIADAKDIEEREQNFKRNMVAFKQTKLDNFEIGVTEKIEKDFNVFCDGMNKAVDLVKAGKKDEATYKINEATQAKNDFQKNLKDLAQYNEDLGKKINTENDVAFAKSIKISTVLVVLATVMAIVLTFVITRSIVNPLRKAIERLNAFSNGDFSGEVDRDYMSRKDEIGEIATGLYKVQSSMTELLKNIIEESSKIKVVVDNNVENITVLNEDIESVAATTQELSAGMEETAASAEEMSATSQEIERVSKSIAEKAEEGAGAANEINTRAIEIKNDVMSAMSKSENIFNSTKEKLENAIEGAKVVEQINILSDSIMAITAQTNLLALNAAIEAARAGEVGRGFTVVAEEIRKLAEESKDTVTEISKVTEKVVVSVKELSDSSMGLLKFMLEDVGEDYDKMIVVAEKYKEDAEFVNNLVSNFSESSEELFESVKDMIRTIDGVAGAANEGASGTLNIVNKVSDITEKSISIKEEIEKSEETVKILNEQVSKFKFN